MPPSALLTFASISACRGAFSAATKLLANELTSTPEPEPKALINPAAADLAAVLPVGVAVAEVVDVVVPDVVAVLEVVEVVAVTMMVVFFNYLM